MRVKGDNNNNNNDDEKQTSDEAMMVVAIDRHLKAGWWGLAIFIALGAVLELLHAMKSPSYVDAGHETTRLLLRLAHAHGTLISLVNLAYAFTLRARPPRQSGGGVIASSSLLAALVLLPGGFFLGALWAHGGDPGLGIILVPVGAAALFVGAIVVARSISQQR